MELIINIPEEKYNTIKNKMYCGIYDAEVYEAIANGTTLPKGHGRLIDEDTIAGDGSWDWSDRLDATPTIIEADTEESNTDNKLDDELYADAIDAFKVYATDRK